MKLEMAKNSLFAILLRSPWWVSALVALAIGLVAVALLPPAWRIVGALSGFPFVVISALAAVRQWKLPSAARVEQTRLALARIAWPAFWGLLEQAFARDGYGVERQPGPAVDAVLTRQGRRMFVSARRWKSAHTGLETLRALQQAREAADDGPDALYIGLGVLSDPARAFAAQHRIAVWQLDELALALRGLALPA